MFCARGQAFIVSSVKLCINCYMSSVKLIFGFVGMVVLKMKKRESGFERER